MNQDIDRCEGTDDYDQNTADDCYQISGHLFHRGITYQDGSFDARCIRCGLNARLKRDQEHGMAIEETW